MKSPIQQTRESKTIKYVKARYSSNRYIHKTKECQLEHQKFFHTRKKTMSTQNIEEKNEKFYKQWKILSPQPFK